MTQLEKYFSITDTKDVELAKSFELIANDEAMLFYARADEIAAELNALDGAYHSVKSQLPTLAPAMLLELAKAKIAPPRLSKRGYSVRGRGTINAAEHHYETKGKR